MSLHGGRVFDLPHPESVLDFSSNINPYGPPRRALAAAATALEQVRVYPDPEQRALRRAASRWTGLPETMLVFGNGASDLLGALMGALGPRRVVLPVPTFGEYRARADRLGIPVHPVPLEESREFAPSRETLEETLAPGGSAGAVPAQQPHGPGLDPGGTPPPSWGLRVPGGLGCCWTSVSSI